MPGYEGWPQCLWNFCDVELDKENLQDSGRPASQPWEGGCKLPGGSLLCLLRDHWLSGDPRPEPQPLGGTLFQATCHHGFCDRDTEELKTTAHEKQVLGKTSHREMMRGDGGWRRDMKVP